MKTIALVAALALPSLALAQGTPATPTTPAPTMTDKTTDKTAPRADKAAKLSDGDVKIMAHLQHVNKMEIDLGKLAQKNGTAAVKNYAETLEKDHTSANQDLMAFAKQRKLATIPADKPQTEADKQEHKAMMAAMAKLKQTKGPEFDREFLSMMVQDHDKELAKVDVAIGNATDPDLQAILKAVKPVLQRHADQARDLQKTVTTSSNQTSPNQPSTNNQPTSNQPSTSQSPTGMQPPQPPSQLPSENTTKR